MSTADVAKDLLFRHMYLSREYRIVNSIKDELQGIIVAPAEGAFNVPDPNHVGSSSTGRRTSSSSDLDDAVAVAGPHSSTWKGVIFIRSKDSFWSRGAFPFTIHFPLKYPFECPVCVFDSSIKSHPLLREGRVVQFQAEYTSLNPMQVSVFVRLLKFLRRTFAPNGMFTEAGSVAGAAVGSTGLTVDAKSAQLDVKRSSIAIVDQKSPYYKLLTEEMLEAVVQRANEKKALLAAESDEAAEEEVASPGAAGKGKGMVETFDTWFSHLFGSKFISKSRELLPSRN